MAVLGYNEEENGERFRLNLVRLDSMIATSESLSEKRSILCDGSQLRIIQNYTVSKIMNL